MKKVLLVCLAVLMFLSGCSRDTAPAVTTVPETEAAAEKISNGAVTVYPLEDQHYTDMTLMGDRLLLLSDTDKLTVFQCADGKKLASAEAPTGFSFDSPDFSIQ